jgi:hypothetical protein
MMVCEILIVCWVYDAAFQLNDDYTLCEMLYPSRLAMYPKSNHPWNRAVIRYPRPVH